MEFVNDYELTARYATVKSFYGKAKVREYNDDGTDVFVLYSYDTPVLSSFNGKLHRVSDDSVYTTTTLRHCREFAEQFDYPTRTKKEFLKLKVFDV